MRDKDRGTVCKVFAQCAGNPGFHSWNCIDWAWQCLPIMPAPGWWKQEGQKFKVFLCCTPNWRSARAIGEPRKIKEHRTPTPATKFWKATLKTEYKFYFTPYTALVLQPLLIDFARLQSAQQKYFGRQRLCDDIDVSEVILTGGLHLSSSPAS